MELGLRVRFVFPLGRRLGGAKRGRSAAQLGAILMALSDSALSASELAATLWLESKTGAFKRRFKEVLRLELIEYRIPEKPRSRLRKYRLTEKGRKILRKLTGQGKRRREASSAARKAKFDRINAELEKTLLAVWRDSQH